MNGFLEARMFWLRCKAMIFVGSGLLCVFGVAGCESESLPQASSGDSAGIKLNEPTADASKPASAAANEIEIGKMFEEEERLDDSEKAYSKALETATGTEREEAKTRLEAILKRKNGLWVKHVEPGIDKFKTSLSDIVFGIIAAVLAILGFWILKRLVAYLGQSWGKSRLQIGEFTDATTGHTGLAIAEVLKEVVEEVQEYYRPRDRFRFGSFSSLIVVDSPESSELMEVVADVIPGDANKVLEFVTKGYRKPHYLIKGLVQEAGLQYRLLVKLVRKGATIQVWDVTVAAANLHEAQGDLALDVVLHLKGVVEANAS
jgi:hypothetical protein